MAGDNDGVQFGSIDVYVTTLHVYTLLILGPKSPRNDIDLSNL